MEFWNSPIYKISRRLGFGRDVVIMVDFVNRAFGFASFFDIDSFDNWDNDDIKNLINALKKRGFNI